MRPIIERLRERKVIQWGAGYLASAWLLYQLLQSLGEPWGILPEHLRTLQMVLGLGLPTALVLAWYHGEKGQQRITRSEAVALLAVLLLTAGAYTAIRPRLEAELSGPPGLETVFDESVVVLPFADLSPLGDQDYLALGIAEELLNVLAQVPELKVISRTSAFAFSDRAGMTLPEIAERLRVAHVLEGSVRKSGDDVRVTVQLIDTRTDTHLLSANYDGNIDDVIALQDSIAAKVVSSFRSQILGSPPGLAEIHPDAYQLFLLGRHILNQRDEDWFERSRVILEQVVDAEPSYVPAMLWLSIAYFDESLDKPATLAEPLRARAEELVALALIEDPNSARAHGMRSGLLHPADLDGMAREMQRALDLAPRDPEILMWAGLTLQWLDRNDEAIPFLEYKVERDPLDIISLSNLALGYHYAGDYERNIATRQRLDALNPGSQAAGIAIALLMLGRPTEAAQLAADSELPLISDLVSALVAHSLGQANEYRRRAQAFDEEWGSERPIFAALVHAWGGRADAAFRWLDTLTPLTASLGGRIPLTSRPEFESLHSDPRWNAFLERVGQSRERLHAVRFEPDPIVLGGPRNRTPIR